MGKVVVIGSSNTDMVVRSRRIPVAGETILGGNFMMNPGGKGANQAVAAARMGGGKRDSGCAQSPSGDRVAPGDLSVSDSDHSE